MLDTKNASSGKELGFKGLGSVGDMDVPFGNAQLLLGVKRCSDLVFHWEEFRNGKTVSEESVFYVLRLKLWYIKGFLTQNVLGAHFCVLCNLSLRILL